MKKSIKKAICLIMIVALITTMFTGCSNKPSKSTDSNNVTTETPKNNDKKIIIKASLSQAFTEPPVLAATHFKEIVEKKSNGAIEVQLYPDNQLGNERDVIEGIQLGTVELAFPSLAPFTGFVPSMSIFSLPFIYRDKEHMYGVLDDIGMTYAPDCEKIGVKLLGFFDVGLRNILTTKKPINSLDDLKGLKIRTMESAIQLDSFAAFGASPLPMAYGEVYTSLESNVIDGAEAANTNYYAKKFYEPAPNWAMVGWNNDLEPVIMSLSFYNSLSDEHKVIIDESIKETIALERELYSKSEGENLELLIKEGVNITKPDRQPFMDASQSVYKKWEEKLGGREKIDAIINHGK